MIIRSNVLFFNWLNKIIHAKWFVVARHAQRNFVARRRCRIQCNQCIFCFLTVCSKPPSPLGAESWNSLDDYLSIRNNADLTWAIKRTYSPRCRERLKKHMCVLGFSRSRVSVEKSIVSDRRSTLGRRVCHRMTLFQKRCLKSLNEQRNCFDLGKVFWILHKPMNIIHHRCPMEIANRVWYSKWNWILRSANENTIRENILAMERIRREENLKLYRYRLLFFHAWKRLNNSWWICNCMNNDFFQHRR